MKKVYKLLFGLQLFVGIGAIFGGLMAILFPEGPGGMPTDVLKYSPFSNFLIPGIILFAVIGLGSVFSAIMIRRRTKYLGYISSIFSWALPIWIVVQCIMLNTVVHLHIIFFTIGLVEAVLSMIILFKDRLFPANVVLNIYKSIRNI